MGSRQEREIMHLVREQIPGIRISLVQVEKNNGSIKKGFEIYAKEENSGIVVYQENLEAACGDSCTAEEAAVHICRTVEKALDAGINQEEIRDWETVKHRVYKKMVNYERNSRRLPAVLHKRYLDLAEVYYIRIPIQKKELAVSEIPAGMLEEWGIPEEEVAAWAELNTEADGYYVQSMSSFMADTLFPGVPSPAGFPDTGMRLILNRRKEYGAGILGSRGKMKKFMEQIGEDCYILPCSVHELIAIPESQGWDAKILQELVREVNRSNVVSSEEFLSDSVYFCHMDTGEVELCCGR